MCGLGRVGCGKKIRAREGKTRRRKEERSGRRTLNLGAGEELAARNCKVGRMKRRLRGRGGIGRRKLKSRKKVKRRKTYLPTRQRHTRGGLKGVVKGGQEKPQKGTLSKKIKLTVRNGILLSIYAMVK